jgi:hypothetical protein
MKHLKGQTLFTVQRVVDPQKLHEVASALDSATAATTATLMPFFGVVVGGEERILEFLELDLARSLLAGFSCEWVRPFRPRESVTAEVSVEDVYEKPGMQFGVVRIRFMDEAGETIQTQRATFVERAAA